MKLGEIDISDDSALSFHMVDDLSDTQLRLGDYIRLKGLQVGMILYLKNDGGGQKIIFIGNGTPYEGLTTVSHDGWYWKLYNHWFVNRVLRIQLESNGSFLEPNYVKDIERMGENVSQAS